MSFISDIRAKRQVRAYSNKNEDIIQRYLSKPLARDDLQNIVGMLSHPEIHQPLMKHMDDLLKQPNFDNSLKEQFADRLQKLPRSSQRDAALDRLTTAFEATGSLSDKLRTIKPEDKKPSLQERIRQRIQDTYTAINAQVQRAQDRVNNAKDTAKNRLAEKRDNIVGKVDKMKAFGRHRIDDARERVTNSVFKMQSTVMPAFDMLKERVTKKFNNFRDEYHSRKLTYQNDNNLRAALAKGLDAETLADGIDSMQLPEIRYPMVHNADAILRQKSMTPKLADDFFNAALDYVASLDKKNPLREKFQQAFNDYDARVANQTENTADKNENREFEKQQKVSQAFDAQHKQKPDVKNAELSGFNEHGQAEYYFPNGENKSEQTISEMMSTEYPSDYMPPDDLPVQLNDEDYEVLNKMESSYTVSENDIDNAFTLGLENLEPPESSLQM